MLQLGADRESYFIVSDVKGSPDQKPPELTQTEGAEQPRPARPVLRFNRNKTAQSLFQG